MDSPAEPATKAPRVLPDQPVQAILLMLSSGLVFSCMDGLSKYLARDYSPVLVTWGRYLFVLLYIMPLLAARWTRRPFHTRRPAHQAVRGGFMIGASLFFVSALAQLPIAQATATAFVAPMFVTALSIPLLGEQVGIRRWLAVAVGFAGVLIIVRPGGGGFGPTALYPVLSAASWASAMIITRMMRLADPALTTLFYTALVGVLALTAALPVVWQAITPEAWFLLALCGALSLLGQYFQVRAFLLGSASLLAPFSYAQIIGSTVIGVLAFHNFPDRWTWFGAAIVIASGVYVWHRERVRARQHAAG